MAFSESSFNLLIMIVEMLWNFIIGKCTSSLPEILSSGTQIGKKITSPIDLITRAITY